MEHETFLLATAQISVAFAGFTGIVTVLGRHASGEWGLGDVLRFWQMIEVSLLATVFSLVPLLFYAIGEPQPIVWGASSAMLALASGIQMCRSVFRTVKAFRSSDATLSPLFTLAFSLIGLIMVWVLAANAAGFIFQQSPAPYLVGIFWEVCLASILFWRLLKFSGLPYKPPREPIKSQQS